MGTGYIRNDTSNNIADGNVINAADLDGEFDAVQAAFSASTGHSHDGTTGEGPLITSAGLATGAVTAGAVSDNSIALGTKTTGNYVAAGAVAGTGLSGSAGAEGATFTVTSNATNANTASTIVARDGSGDFSAGTITATITGNVTGNLTGNVGGNVTGDVVGDVTGALTGNADTATVLATARSIAGKSFNGSADITIASSDLSDAGLLSSNLDVVTHSIISTSNRDIAITPNGTGDVILDGLKYPQADGSNGQFLKTDGSGQLSFGTVSTPSLASLGIDNHDNLTVDGSGNVALGTSSIAFGSSKWTVVVDDTNNTLDFAYNGTVVFSLASNGAAISANNVTAFGSP